MSISMKNRKGSVRRMALIALALLIVPAFAPEASAGPPRGGYRGRSYGNSFYGRGYRGYAPRAYGYGYGGRSYGYAPRAYGYGPRYYGRGYNGFYNSGVPYGGFLSPYYGSGFNLSIGGVPY